MMLSILICSLHKRVNIFTALMQDLANQAYNKPVEILSEVDSGEMTTGEKRNKLLQRAEGKYIVFVDDDDYIYPYYIEEILKASESDPDAMAINGSMTTNGGNEIQWFIAKDNPYCAVQRNGREVYLRFQNHISPIRGEIAKLFKFPHATLGEDYVWALAIHKSGLIKTESTIEKPMYIYKYLTNK